MEVLRVSAYYKAPLGLSVVNLAAACPTGKSSTICGWTKLSLHHHCCVNGWFY